MFKKTFVHPCGGFRGSRFSCEGGGGVVFSFSVDLRVFTAENFICLSMKTVPRLVACLLENQVKYP